MKKYTYITLCCVDHKLHKLKERLLTILWELQSDCYKNVTEFYQISFKNLLHVTDCSPQLMACMKLAGREKNFREV